MRGDTIRNPEIMMRSPYPDRDAVTIRLRKNKNRSYKPRSIAYYMHDNKYYQSLPLKKKGKREKRIFARKLVGGDVSVYIAKDGRKKEFYLQKDDEGLQLLPWEGYMKVVERNIDDFDNFDTYMSAINKKLYYNPQHMVEYFSHYNAYRAPDKYLPIEHEFVEHPRFSIVAGVSFSSISRVGSGGREALNIQNTLGLSGYSFGISVAQQIRDIYSMNFGLTQNYRNMSFMLSNGRTYTIRSRSIRTPAFISFEGYVSNTIKWYFDFGGFIQVPTRSFAVDDRENAIPLTSDIRMGPLGGVGLAYRLRDNRQMRMTFRISSFKQKLIGSSAISRNFLPDGLYRFTDMGLVGSYEF